MVTEVVNINCCVTDLRYKEVISNSDGTRLGCVNDVEIDTCSGNVVSIVIYGTAKCFGIFGKTHDIKICWKDICVIGEDTILVNYCPPCREENLRRKRSGIFDSFFS